jgi:mRNA interferase MazF
MDGVVQEYFRCLTLGFRQGGMGMNANRKFGDQNRDRTHSVIAVSTAVGFRYAKISLKLLILSIACSILPDADVFGYHWLYIPSHHFFGHRGFFHSLFFAALLSILIVSIGYRKEVTFSKPSWSDERSTAKYVGTSSYRRIKKHPVFILTRDSVLEYLGEVTIAPITTTVRNIPSEVFLSKAEGMPRDCAVNCDHLQTVSAKIGPLITSLPQATWRAS